MGTATTRNNKLLPFVLIEAASTGNVNAINAVLKHFERYIIALATRELYDENGNALHGAIGENNGAGYYCKLAGYSCG